MTVTLFRILLFLTACPVLLFSQKTWNYFRYFKSDIGSSAISISTITARSIQFSHPVYQAVADTQKRHLLLSLRQRDATGKLYTNRGFHCYVKDNDSVAGVFEDSKLDFEVLGDFMLWSNEKRTSRFNRALAYEQYEFPARVFYTIRRNETGFMYNPTIKQGNNVLLSCVSLSDAKLKWSAAIPQNFGWNDVQFLNDTVCIIGSGGLYAVGLNSGLLWSYPSVTGLKSGKPLTVSTFNQSTYDRLFRVHVNTNDEGMLTGLASNILVLEGTSYFASSEKLIAVGADGKIIWEKDLREKGLAGGILVGDGSNIILINLALAVINQNNVVYGKPYAASYNKHNGSEVYSSTLTDIGNLVDMKMLGDQKLVASRSKITRVTSAGLEKVFQFSDVKFGNFIEFIDGNEYFTEKEGFFIPLNFINDKVIYFKCDNDKVYGLSGNEIEYEYHFTELYREIGKVNDKRVIAQRKGSLLISRNYEKLASFMPADKVISFNDRVYFVDGANLHIVDVEHLK